MLKSESGGIDIGETDSGRAERLERFAVGKGDAAATTGITLATTVELFLTFLLVALHLAVAEVVEDGCES